MPLGVSLSEGLGSTGWTLKARDRCDAVTMPCLLRRDKKNVGARRYFAISHRRCPRCGSSTLLVRRWVHELTFKSPWQCVEAANREAPRCDLSLKATGAEMSMFLGVLRCLRTAYRCIWIGIRN